MKAIFVCKQITASDIMCDKSRCFSSSEKVHCLTSMDAVLLFYGCGFAPNYLEDRRPASETVFGFPAE
jgi:hypothetical protein